MSKSNDVTEINVRCSRYSIVESQTACPQCARVTAVFAFALPVGYESVEVDDQGNETWTTPGLAVVLSYVEYLSESVVARLRAVTSSYRLTSLGGSDSGMWSNHCEHCDAVLEEEEIHGDPDSAFGPSAAEGLVRIELYPVHELFEAWASRQSHDVKELDA